MLKHLLFWPVTAPKFLVEFSLEKVEGVVRQELTDDARVKQELMELQFLLEMGEIEEGEYAHREGELMAQLREVRRWREEFGMAMPGGPVRVRSDDMSPEGEATEWTPGSSRDSSTDSSSS